MGRRRAIEIIEDGRHHVDGLGQRRDARGLTRFRRLDHERNVGDLGINRHEILHPILVLAEHRAVVGGEDDERVFPETKLLELVENAAAPVIGHGQQRGVAFADMLDRLGRFLHDIVARPVEERAVPRVVIEIAIFLRAIKRLVRIEELDLQKPIIRFSVVFQPSHRRLRRLRPGEILLLNLSRAIGDVLAPLLAHMFR